MASRVMLGYIFEGLLAVAGLLVLWRKVFRPGARQNWPAVQCPPWQGGGIDILLYIFCALAGGIALPALAGVFIRRSTLSANSILVLLSVAFQTGLILGILGFSFLSKAARVAKQDRPTRAWSTGTLTFLAAIPVVLVVSAAWQGILQLVGFDVQPQQTIAMFEQIESVPLRILFIVFATVVAPIAEELIFRAGIFRYLRGRIPSGWAVLISALLFGSAHLLDSFREGLGAFLPLTVLGALFALAYERTGRIGTTMVAHSLFNLNTIVLLLCGITN